jgi:hypothetical protein
VQQYSPTESAKVLNKQICRRPNVKFNPQHVVDLATRGAPMYMNADEEKINLVCSYIDVSEIANVI